MAEEEKENQSGETGSTKASERTTKIMTSPISSARLSIGSDDSVSEKRPDGNAGPVRKIGKYRLIRLLGRGGMGNVHLGLNPNTDDLVAIKALPRDAALQEKHIERFRREARLAAQIKHPNVVRVLDADHDPDRDLHYIVMEYVEGQSFSEIMKKNKSGMPIDEALRAMICVTKALEAAAEKGIIHRDIKPGNIMLQKDGEIKLADLGLAKQLGEESNISMAKQTVGTPYYMSPEQIETPADIDSRSDIYSLGATFYRLVTGTWPFDAGSTLQILRNILKDPLPHPCVKRPDLPAPVGAVILKMMARNPEDRYRDPAELLTDLKKLSENAEEKDLLADPAKVSQQPFIGDRRGGKPAAGIPKVKSETPAKTHRGRRTLLIAAGLIIAALLVVGMLGQIPITVKQEFSKTSAETLRNLVQVEEQAGPNETDYWTSAPRMVKASVHIRDTFALRLARTFGKNRAQTLDDQLQEVLDEKRIVRLTRGEDFDRAIQEIAIGESGGTNELYKARLGQLLSVHQELQLYWESTSDEGTFPLSLELIGTVQETGQTMRAKADCPSKENLRATLATLVDDFFQKYNREYPLQGRILDAGNLKEKDNLSLNLGRYHGVKPTTVFGVYEKKDRNVGGQNRPYCGVKQLAQASVNTVEKDRSILEIVEGSLEGQDNETVLLKQILAE